VTLNGVMTADPCYLRLFCVYSRHTITKDLPNNATSNNQTVINIRHPNLLTVYCLYDSVSKHLLLWYICG